MLLSLQSIAPDKHLAVTPASFPMRSTPADPRWRLTFAVQERDSKHSLLESSHHTARLGLHFSRKKTSGSHSARAVCVTASPSRSAEAEQCSVPIDGGSGAVLLTLNVSGVVELHFSTEYSSSGVQTFCWQPVASLQLPMGEANENPKLLIIN